MEEKPAWMRHSFTEKFKRDAVELVVNQAASERAP
jgi:hypothetical protein